jgi:electron transport complex protein RnfC
MKLMPQQLKRLIDSRKLEEADKMGILDCMECGCCAFTCPASLPLIQTFKMGKKLVMAERKKAKSKQGK